MKRYAVQYANGSQVDLANLAAFIMERLSEERAMRYIRSIVDQSGRFILHRIEATSVMTYDQT